MIIGYSTWALGVRVIGFLYAGYRLPRSVIGFAVGLPRFSIL